MKIFFFVACLVATTAQAQTVPSPRGGFKLIVYLVDCSNCPEGYPVSVPQQMGQDADQFFRWGSNNLMWFTGANPATPPDAVKVRIAQASGSCNLTLMASQAKTAGQAQGYDPANYQRYLYLMTGLANCGFGSGSSDVNTQAWVWYDPLANRVSRHELGHTFKLQHAKSLDCPSCTPEEYGNTFDVMGSTNGEIGPADRDKLGWMNVSGGSQMTVVNAAGEYTIQPFDVNQGILALKIQRGANSYYVSYRTGQGYSSGKPIGVIVEMESVFDQSVNSATRLFKWGKDLYATSPAMVQTGDYINFPADNLYLRLTDLQPNSAKIKVDFVVDPNPVAGWTFCGGDSARCQLPVAGVTYKAAYGSVQNYVFANVSDVFYCVQDYFPARQPTVHPVQCYYTPLSGGTVPNPPQSLTLQ